MTVISTEFTEVPILSKHEEWRAVPGHPDYMVSNMGRVRSYKKRGARDLVLQVDDAGYVRAHIDGKKVLVHRIVAAAWHGPCPDNHEVAHKNHVRGDNRPENLKYVTRQENLAERDDRARVRDRCRRGHELSGDNVYIVPSSGTVVCKKCRRLSLSGISKRKDQALVEIRALATRWRDGELSDPIQRQSGKQILDVLNRLGLRDDVIASPAERRDHP